MLVPWESAWAAEATCPEAPESETTAPRTSPSTLPKRRTISRRPPIICDVSSRPRTSMVAVRSPEASVRVRPTTSCMGPEMPRASTHASTRATSGPTMPPTTRMRRTVFTREEKPSTNRSRTVCSSWRRVSEARCMGSSSFCPLPLRT